MPEAHLAALAHRWPTRAHALAEMGHLEAVLALPKGTVHVVSDVHGEHKKLGHVIRNASGSLRVLVEQVFTDRSEEDRRTILNLVYYCDATWAHVGLPDAEAGVRRAFFLRHLGDLLLLARLLSRTWTDRAVERVFPAPLAELFRELLLFDQVGLNATAAAQVQGPARPAGYLEALVQPFLARGLERDLLRLVSRLVRNLSVHELVVAGDLGDRGPRLDRVVDILMKQPRVAVAWGNHDLIWMGACLGQPALIATVMRISLRYGRTEQLEEGYGIPLAPLQRLAQQLYGDDPCARFQVKIPPDENTSGRDAQTLARMQKAIAVLQFKLEGQCIARNPDFGLDDRRLLRAVDPAAGAVRLGDVTHPLLDTHLPTLDAQAPETLSAEEAECLAALQTSFLRSQTLWRQMQFLRARGAMVLLRDHHIIFHGCIPIDEDDAFQAFAVEPGQPVAGPALFAAFERTVHRAFRDRAPRDLDLLWYLWTGPRSPLFGKDRMTTFETHFVADEVARKEHKNAWFKRVHDAGFCRRVFAAFGADPAVGFIVNGHVPVRVEKGEAPVKASGMAVTIDGAFSEAYGDRGYTLILDAARTSLAEHHHFGSVAEAVRDGADIVPTVTPLKTFAAPRAVGQTETGQRIRDELSALEQLVAAYEDNRISEADNDAPF